MNLTCKLACASAAAYCIDVNDKTGRYNPSDGKNTQYNAVGFVSDPFVIVSNKINAVLIGSTETEIIVSFRGTLTPALNIASIEDWILDFTAKPIELSPLSGKVHSGFAKAFSELSEGIKSSLETLLSEKKLPVFVTGHSKGGGIAPIAALFIKKEYNITPKRTITFAAPKSGNSVFCNAYNAEFTNHVRYENYLDLVPLLPPSKSFIDLLMGLPFWSKEIKKLLEDAANWNYETVGTLSYIDSHGKVKKPASPMTERIFDIFKKIVVLEFGEIGAAHSIECNHGYMDGACGDSNICKGSNEKLLNPVKKGMFTKFISFFKRLLSRK